MPVHDPPEGAQPFHGVGGEGLDLTHSQTARGPHEAAEFETPAQMGGLEVLVEVVEFAAQPGLEDFPHPGVWIAEVIDVEADGRAFGTNTDIEVSIIEPPEVPVPEEGVHRRLERGLALFVLGPADLADVDVGVVVGPQFGAEGAEVLGQRPNERP